VNSRPQLDLIMPTKLEIARYWGSIDASFCEDTEELSCFACGYFYSGRYDKTPEKIPLQKAHIIPDSCGGKNEVSNLVLLCPMCHREAPMINDRDSFLKWIKARPHFYLQRQNSLLVELNNYGIELSKFADITCADFSLFLQNLRHETSLHADFEGLGGGRIPMSTMAALLAKYQHLLPIKGCLKNNSMANDLQQNLW
jgi:hypothetical protein